MSEVKRYGPTCDCVSEMAWGDYVLASDYEALQAECDRIKDALLGVMSRNFATKLSEMTAEKELDKCLSEGIAALTSERDQLKARVDELETLLAEAKGAYQAAAHWEDMLPTMKQIDAHLLGAAQKRG